MSSFTCNGGLTSPRTLAATESSCQSVVLARGGDDLPASIVARSLLVRHAVFSVCSFFNTKPGSVRTSRPRALMVGTGD